MDIIAIVLPCLVVLLGFLGNKPKSKAKPKSKKRHTSMFSVTDKNGHRMTFRVKKNGGLQRLGRCYQYSSNKARF